VVENAPYGIEAAKRAGMYCVAVCSTLDATHLVAADAIVRNLAEVAEIFME
jgi:beta-phosphoglucomutase